MTKFIKYKLFIVVLILAGNVFSQPGGGEGLSINALQYFRFRVLDERGSYINPDCKIEITQRENGLHDFLTISDYSKDTVSYHNLIKHYSGKSDEKIIGFKFSYKPLNEITITLYNGNDSMAIWFFPHYFNEWGAVPLTFNLFEVKFVPNQLLAWRGYKTDSLHRPVFEESKMMYGNLKTCDCDKDYFHRSSDSLFNKTDDKPFSGTCYRYYGNKKNLSAEVYYKNGKIHGSTTFHYSGGKSKTEFVNGKDSARNHITIGDLYEWYAHGQMRTHEFYKNGIPVSGKEWYEDGKLKEEYKLNKYSSTHTKKGILYKGQKTEIKYEWWTDGKLKEKTTTEIDVEENYRSKKASIIRERYFEDGKLREKRWHEGNELVKEIEYYPTGKLRHKYTYDWKRKKYTEIEWDEKGKRKVEKGELRKRNIFG